MPFTNVKTRETFKDKDLRQCNSSKNIIPHYGLKKFPQTKFIKHAQIKLTYIININLIQIK